MRRLVVCCDGTWKTPSDVTNVALLHEHLAQDDAQVVRYFSGAGIESPWWRRLPDAAIGSGLAEGVQEVYAWLATTWRPGDEIVLFGFSRGAYTVRSLAGMLWTCGLAEPTPTDPDATAVAARMWHEAYRGNRPLADIVRHPDFGPARPDSIAFLGVWDTVGALGVPDTFGLLSRVLGGDVRFRDVRLSPGVRHARQALALDERRGPYVPAVWSPADEFAPDSLVQLWFPGGHGDVGGGGGPQRRGLADGALRWMADEVEAAVGLRWARPVTLTGTPTASIDDGVDGAWQFIAPRPRTVPHVVDGAPDVHPSALARRAADLDPPYRPGVVPAVGVPRQVSVPADEPWYETGLYLAPGAYRVQASGTWRDHGVSVPATGARVWPVPTWPSWGLGALLDGLRRIVRTISDQPRADVVGSRRVPGARRMELVLAVADDRIDATGTVTEGTTVGVRAVADGELVLDRGGYLYAFANDSWVGYATNSGAVTLTVTRSAAARPGR